MKRSCWMLMAVLLALTAVAGRAAEPAPGKVPLPQTFVVPNFHPASCGWLTNWSMERNYCANSYLDHLDRVRDDPNYAFVISECNNMIAIRNFQPARFEELKSRIKEGRVEAVNAFFLEPSISLSGGEALVRMGVEGLRWQQALLGVRPRFCWAIDVCGTHAQMPQICQGLGLEALVMCRPNTTGKTVFWYESPDGTKVLTLSPGHYSEFGPVFKTEKPLTRAELAGLEKNLEAKKKITPAGAPLLILGGGGDYNLAPHYKENPKAFLEQWKQWRPDAPLKFATLSQYFDALKPLVEAGKLDLPTKKNDGPYFFNSFWIESPRVKAWYRQDEHALQAAEALATIASLKAGYEYPVQDLENAWLLMCLNMDRNTLWGSAGGMVFEHPTSWDVKDRLEWVQRKSREVSEAAVRKMLGAGDAVAIYNPLNFQGLYNVQVLTLDLPSGKSLPGPCEMTEDGRVLCEGASPSLEVATFKLKDKPADAPKPIPLPEEIENSLYVARIDPVTGALVSLKIRSRNLIMSTESEDSEMLGGPANVVVAEKGVYKGDPGDMAMDRPQRPRLKSTSDFKQTVTATEGPVAITVTATGDFLGGPCKRVMRFYKQSPRIDFITELNDIPDKTIVVAEFPLAESPLEIRRGVPYGFSHGAWARPNPALPGWTKGITPAVRWSDYRMSKGRGLAIFDRGLSGREIVGQTPVIYLYNATDKYYGYPNAWLSGKGKIRLEYAIQADTVHWNVIGIPQAAWEYNSSPLLVNGVKELGVDHKPYIQTSRNVLLEAVRRDGNEIELRMAECAGESGEAEVRVNLPHKSAALTNMLGGEAKPLSAVSGIESLLGPTYKFPVRPQQIVTMRLKAEKSVPAIQTLTQWDELVPPNKRAALNEYVADKKGHPPKGN